MPELRTRSAGAKVTEKEYVEIEKLAASRRLNLGEWCRETLLARVNGQEPRAATACAGAGQVALMAELVALRPILFNVLFKLAKGQTLTAQFPCEELITAEFLYIMQVQFQGCGLAPLRRAALKATCLPFAARGGRKFSHYPTTQCAYEHWVNPASSVDLRHLRIQPSRSKVRFCRPRRRFAILVVAEGKKVARWKDTKLLYVKRILDFDRPPVRAITAEDQDVPVLFGSIDAEFASATTLHRVGVFFRFVLWRRAH
jgi:hypothetical protein